MAKGGSSGPQTTTNQTIIDPSLKAAWQGNVDMANMLTSGLVPYRSGSGGGASTSPVNVIGNANGYWDPGSGEWTQGTYSGGMNGLPYDPNGDSGQILNADGTPFIAPTSLTPGFNADQLAYQGGVRGLAGLTPNDLGASTFQNAANFQAPTATAARVAGVTPMTASTVAPVADISAKAFTDYDFNKYANPYMSNVVDPVKAYLDTQAERARNAADMGRPTGAFGGSRHGVADSLLEGEIALQGGNVLSGLYGDAFKTSAGLITSDANRALAADQSNLSKNAQIAMANAQLGQDAASRNFDFSGRTALTNAGFDQQTGLANMEAAMRTPMIQMAGAGGLANANLGSRQVELQNLGLLGDVGNQIYARDQDKLMDPFKALNIRMGAMGGMPMQTGSTSTTTGGPATGTSPLLGGLGGAIGGAGLAGMLGPAGAVGLANPYMMPLVALGGLAGLLS